MSKWSKTPKHLLRESCVKQMCRRWQPGEFIELGSGTGAMTRIFLEKNYRGICYDLGEENRKVARENLAKFGDAVKIIDSFEEIAAGKQFDYLFAFEVLEHIVNDLETLQQWSQYHRTSGRLIVSVPAHMRKYSKEDEAVGHIRRYEKDELIALLENAGYQNIHVANYGFPMGNITRLLSRRMQKQLAENKALTPEEKSIKSGVERSSAVNRLAFLFNPITLSPFSWLQSLFFQKDWGDGYVAWAEKK